MDFPQHDTKSDISMVISDEEYSTDGSSHKKPEEEAHNNIVRHTRQQVFHGKLVVETEEKGQTKQARLPSTLHSIMTRQKSLTKHLQGSEIDGKVSLRIIGAALQLQKEYLQVKQKLGKEKGNRPSKPAVRNTVCQLFHISSTSYAKIMRNYLTSDTIHSTMQQGNVSAKNSRILQTRGLQMLVRNFVREQRSNRKRVTAAQVRQFLREERNVINVAQEGERRYLPQPYKAALRSTQRWLFEYGGYRRGTRKNIVANPDHVRLKQHQNQYSSKKLGTLWHRIAS